MGQVHATGFAAGTQVETCFGMVPVEELEPGDLVETERGLTALVAVELMNAPAVGEMAAVVFARGAIGNDRALTVGLAQRFSYAALPAAARAPFARQAQGSVDALTLWNGGSVKLVEDPGEITYVTLRFAEDEWIFLGAAMAECPAPEGAGDGTADAPRDADIAALIPTLSAAFPEVAARLSRQKAPAPKRLMRVS